MKAIQVFVIATGGLIVLVLLVLFFMGRRPDAGRVTGVVEIGVPPATVMTWLTEPARMKQWVSWLRDVQGDTTAAKVGRRQVWVMDDGRSGAVQLATELVMYAPPDSMRLRLTVAGLVEGENLYTLTDLGGRTRLVVAGRYRHPNHVIALLEPLATPETAQKLRADLARLNVLVSQGALEGDGSAAGAAEGGEGAVTPPR